MTILVDAATFGLGPDDLGRALAAEGIETRRYYAPPVHTMQAYRSLAQDGDLEVTNDIASRSLTLPLWSGMGADRVRRVAEAIEAIAGARRRIGVDERSPSRRPSTRRRA